MATTAGSSAGGC